MRGARRRAVHDKGPLEQVPQPVADQGHVLGLGVVQGHAQHPGRMARLLEEFKHLGIAIGVDISFCWHNSVRITEGGRGGRSPLLTPTR